MQLNNPPITDENCEIAYKACETAAKFLFCASVLNAAFLTESRDTCIASAITSVRDAASSLGFSLVIKGAA